MEAFEGPPGEPAAAAAGSRRGTIAALLTGLSFAGAAVAALMRPRQVEEGEYRRVVNWKIPGGEGLFIAIPRNPRVAELRALGERLRRDLRDRRNMVVMVFDDAGAARDVRRGSRVLGESRFHAALSHQRAMYIKDTARGEHAFTIFGEAVETIRY